MIVSCRSRSSVSSRTRPPAAQLPRRWLRAGWLAILIAVATASCSSNTTPPPSGGSPGPNPSGQRLSWAQVATSQAILQNYDFMLFVDGVRSALTGSSCMGIAPAFDCLAPLPVLSPGRHVLELSALDRTTGLESARSEQLIVNTTATASTIFGTTRPPVTSAASDAAVTQSPASAVPSVACAPQVATCFSMSTVSDDFGDVRRLVALPDSRLLALRPGAVAQVLPGGEPDRLAIDSRRTQAEVADLAVDPDFLANRYVYTAVIVAADGGRTATSIVRFRELDGRFGEPATIAADLPSAAQGLPAISTGPDRRIYLALPSSDDRRAAGPYDGTVLRLTPQGAAAGYERARSPILAVGSSRPASLAWIDGAHLLLASAASAASQLSAVPWQAPDTFAPTSLPVQGVQRAPLTGGITQLAALPGKTADSGETRVVLLGTAPPALYVARMTTGAAPAVIAIDYVSLGGLAPMTFALEPNGDLLIAARQFAGSPVRLLRLRVDAGQKSS